MAPHATTARMIAMPREESPRIVDATISPNMSGLLMPLETQVPRAERTTRRGRVRRSR
jgi:hypothetical protein